MKSIQKDRVVYTAIFGEYDNLMPVKETWNCDFICFTDNLNLKAHGWKIVLVEQNEQSSMANRRFKMLPHKYLKNYSKSLYVDGNVKITSDPEVLFDKYLSAYTIAIPKHLDRNCLYEEAEYCANVNLVSRQVIEAQMKKYLSEGFPKKFGLSENSVIFRKHNELEVIAAMELWWETYCSGAKRDQLSLQYVIWKKNVKMQFISENPRGKNKYFRTMAHRVIEHLSPLSRIVMFIDANKHRGMQFLIINKVLELIRRFK